MPYRDLFLRVRVYMCVCVYMCVRIRARVRACVYMQACVSLYKGIYKKSTKKICISFFCEYTFLVGRGDGREREKLLGVRPPRTKRHSKGETWKPSKINLTVYDKKNMNGKILLGNPKGRQSMIYLRRVWDISGGGGGNETRGGGG